MSRLSSDCSRGPDMEPAIEALAEKNTRRAWEIIHALGLKSLWESVGAEARLVGSLKTGLLMKHLDIDLHVYSHTLQPAGSFAAIARLAADPAVKRIEYANLLDTDEECLEWHVSYQDTDGRLWRIDMIHLRHGSAFDGCAEKAAARIAEVLTPETRRIILRLKFETPETEKIMGLEYCMAVLRDGVRDYQEFTRWRKANALRGLSFWTP